MYFLTVLIGALYTRLHSSSIAILCNNKKEPVQVHIQYGPSIGHCVRYIVQFPPRFQSLSIVWEERNKRGSTNYQIRPTDWRYPINMDGTPL